ncbi:MAG: single-stranded-DNA-specific exonuclease RecJ [Oscillospiraceae bacterium]|nr:single-stranded-DNA-specific exonuclease RecJ [Oscillospiraceae bacterium]
MKYEQWDLRRGAGMAARQRLEREGIPPLCAAILCARGVDTPEKAADCLRDRQEYLHEPFLMKDMGPAVERIRQGLDRGETMAVYGDYDVDGITSTCLLTEYLTRLGGTVVSYIPDRTEEGYGLNCGAIDYLNTCGVKLIITVDCGITAVDEVEYARERGIDVVVTDHHQCKERLPAACAVVDPRRPDCGYPFPELAGVGVALKVALALTEPERRGEVLRDYCELVAIGTVADVMSLSDENRILVKMGLKALGDTRRPGLRALLGEVGCERGKAVSVTNIGYGLAPRINAAGRMEQAKVALQMLLTRDTDEGACLAQTLCELNRERQGIELGIFEICEQLLEADPTLAGPAIVLAGEGWHQGVVGIVASRLAERNACPTFMICLDNGRGKGSCRSYGGFNLFAALERCAPLLEEYGGHELAAGFTILEENIPAFRAAVCALVDEYAAEHSMVSTLTVDAEVEHCAQLSEEQVDALSLLEPFGAGNPRPVLLLRGACVVSCGDVGSGRHLKMRVRRDGVQLDAIFFGANAAACGVSVGDRLDLVFTPQINEFRGNRMVQLQLCDLRPAPTRAQLERELFRRLEAGETLSRWEAGQLLPERSDFARIWRYLEQSCAAGPVMGPPEQLIRQMGKGQSGLCSYGRSMVCLHVMDDRGLIRVEWSGQEATVSLRPTRGKVDLEQAGMMRLLRSFINEM